MTAKADLDFNGALEKQFIINFDRRCTILLSEEERDALYTSLGNYRVTGQLNPLLDRLSQILNSPIKMDLVEDLRHFIEERHRAQFDRGIPFGDVSTKVVKILTSTPSYDQRQRSTVTTPRSVTPRPTGSVTARGSSTGVSESKRFELTKADNKQQMGFNLCRVSGTRGGIFIKNVIPNSIADRAGLKCGDLLLDINDISLNSLNLGQAASLIESLIETSKVLRVNVLRGSNSQKDDVGTPATTMPKNPTNGESEALPFGDGAKQTNSKIEVFPPSPFRSVGNSNNAGTLKSGIFESGSRDVNTPRLQPVTGTLTGASNRIGQITPASKNSRSFSVIGGHDPVVTLEKYEPKRKTKTVIDLNRKSTRNESDLIRIEEISVDDTESDPRLISSTLPRATHPPSSGENSPYQNKFQSLQLMPPNHRNNSHQANTFMLSPNMGRNTKIIPLIRSYVPLNTAGNISFKQRQISPRKNVFQPEINLVPEAFYDGDTLSPKIQNTNLLYGTFPTFQQQSLSVRSNDGLFQHPGYFQESLHYDGDERYPTPFLPMPPGTRRHEDPVFPTVVPHYRAAPRTKEDEDSYIEPELPHPGMWKSMEDSFYRKLHNGFSYADRQSGKFLSNPDISNWTGYRRNHYGRVGPAPSDIEVMYGRNRYNGHNRYNRYDRYTAHTRSGWRSDHDIDYGTSRHHGCNNFLPTSYRDAPYDYSNQNGDDMIRERLTQRTFRNHGHDTYIEFSDFDGAKAVLDSPHLRKKNRKYKRSNHYDQFSRHSRSNYTPIPSRAKYSAYHPSHASMEVVFGRGVSLDPEMIRMNEFHFDDVPFFGGSEVSVPMAPRRHDELESSRHRQPWRRRKDLEDKESSSLDQEVKTLHSSNKNDPSIRISTKSKSINRSPKVQPRRNLTTPSISSLSSNTTFTPGNPPLNVHVSHNNDSNYKTEMNNISQNKASDDSTQSDTNGGTGEISLLGFSKLFSPRASQRSKPQNSKAPPHENTNLHRYDTNSEPPWGMDHPPSPPALYRSDSQSSMGSNKTSKSDQYDFVEATSEFNKKTKNFVFTQNVGEVQMQSRMASAKELMSGIDWINKSQRILAINETSEVEENSWLVKTGGTDERIPIKQISESLNASSVSTPTEILEKNNKQENPRLEKNSNDNPMRSREGEEKSLAVDSADSGVSMDIPIICLPPKLTDIQPYPRSRPASNRSYAIYQLQNQSPTDHLTESKGSISQSSQRSGSSFSQGNAGLLRDVPCKTINSKYQPTARHRTVNKTLKNTQRQIQIKLDKTCSHLGLCISGGAESKACPNITIDNITKGSAADLEGSLKPGMKLASIDGRSLQGASHAEAVQIIKTSFLDKSTRWMIVGASD